MPALRTPARRSGAAKSQEQDEGKPAGGQPRVPTHERARRESRVGTGVDHDIRIGSALPGGKAGSHAPLRAGIDA